MSSTAPEADTTGGSRYPDELVCDLVTRDGLAVHVRPIRPGDAPRLVEFHEALSSASVYFRFFTLHRHLSEKEVVRFTQVDYEDRLALVAEVEGTLVGVARFDRLASGDEAEVAFVVADAFQHQGLGSLLLHELVRAAGPRGIRRFRAETLEGNVAMMTVFRESGFELETSVAQGVISVGFAIGPGDGPPC
ncbi:MAG TPA: GNAT family N-acetyltransferase [Acidimicrobiales bacterium]|nr:GNAT family N-acetyltransferase [Acidimicrobiales bacterium]